MTNLRLPHQSEPKEWIATAWPCHADWGGAVMNAESEITRLVRTMAGVEPAPVLRPPLDALEGFDPALLESAPIIGADGAAALTLPDITPVTLEPEPAPELAPPPEVLVFAPRKGVSEVREALGEEVTVAEGRAVDIWLRDTGPVFVLGPDGPRAVCFAFNGWGGRYPAHADPKTRRRLIDRADALTIDVDLVAEGGAFESDGQGTVMATRASLLGPKRNPNRDERDVEQALAQSLGAERVIWLNDGLINDHTDGHIDTLARFVRPGLVVCQAPAGQSDPNADVLDAIARTLDRARDADGRRVDVVRVPSPGAVFSADRELLPASHMNYVYAGDAVILPVYDTPNADAARRALEDIIPNRRVLPVSALALIEQGGAFHCATNAAPAQGERA